jgi:hypothetical protein
MNVPSGAGSVPEPSSLGVSGCLVYAMLNNLLGRFLENIQVAVCPILRLQHRFRGKVTSWAF